MPVIGISGSYGGLNAGDEGILTASIALLREAAPDAELVVFSRNADHTRTHHAVGRVVQARDALREDLVREVERLDLLLLGGGGILYDREATTYLSIVRLAQELGVRTATFAVGAGPLERTSEQQAVAEVLEAMDAITVRDVSAKRTLEEIGLQRPIDVTACPALLLEPDPFTEDMLRTEGVALDRPLVGISVREPAGGAVEEQQPSYERLLATAGDFIVERFGADVVFVPLEHDDIREAHRVASEMALAQRATVLSGDYTPRQLLGLMAHLELAVGMRLHFLLFAAVARVPILALPYASKVVSLLEALELPTPKLLHRENAGALLASIDRLWDLRAEQQRVLRERVPALQERARRTVDVVLTLLGREVPGATAAQT